ncbi:hypothetical protein BH23GEM9_BH23GEM9_03600 [soil metagenome]
MFRSRLTSGLTIAVAAMVATACTEAGPLETLDGDAHFSHLDGASGAEMGTTPGWYKGKVVTFLYNKEYECINPPASMAQSGCLLGEEAARSPRGGNDPVLYVLTPLFTPSKDLNLHCPTAGECINHPGDIDITPVQAVLESVLGPLPRVIPLPAHSHVVDTQRGGWWKIEVNGVLTEAAWDAIAAAKSLDEVRVQQAAGTVTGDIDTNMFLFFNVLQPNANRGGPFRN